MAPPTGPLGLRLPAAVGDFVGCAEVDDGVDLERGQPVAAGGGEAVQRVCAVDLAAADFASVRGGVPAEVADVEAALQLHEPGRDVVIGSVCLMPGRHRARLTGWCRRGSSAATFEAG